ncbi:MAG: FHA domain-containing protein [Eubacteriales bacterium]|nr:FHA domain-containing protein [Eubacteriales bacterium]
MGRKYALTALAVLLIILGGSSLCVQAQQTEYVIRQAEIEMPSVTVYLEPSVSEEAVQQGEAFLGAERLTLESGSAASERPIAYYFLLDCSASIPAAAFADMKAGMEQFSEEKLREEDCLTVYTFGDAVQVLYEGGGEGESLQETLADVKNRDQNTLLFEAIATVADQAAEQREYGRKILIVLTDGEDFSLGTATGQEALESLKKCGLSINAVAPESAGKEYVNALGEFVRSSGGELAVVGEEGSTQALGEFARKAQSALCISYRAQNNRVSNQMEILALTMPGEETVTREVLVSEWIPDQEAPVMTGAEKLTENTLKIVFSEPVIHADKVSAWKIRRDGVNVPPESVNIHQDDGECWAELAFSQELYGGEYQIEGVGITDDSQEENALQEMLTVRLEGADAETGTAEEPPGEEGGAAAWAAGGFAGIVTLGLILVFLVVFLVRRKRHGGDKGEQEENKITYTEGDPIRVAEPEQHERIPVVYEAGKELVILADMDGRNIRKIDARIDGSLFVGRSSICNYYFDDASLSKQHFVLEYDGENMYVTDLNSSNGTRVNGIPIHRRYRLHQDDVITAGTLRFRLKW